jgi:hypothetical protein
VNGRLLNSSKTSYQTRMALPLFFKPTAQHSRSRPDRDVFFELW